MEREPFTPFDINPASIHPIIYVRGFAATRGEMDETSADPFCGFNLGSTIFRATPDADRRTRKDLDINEWRSGTLSIPIPFTRDKIPGARGRLRFVARPWNVCTRSQRPAHWHGPSSRRASRRV